MTTPRDWNPSVHPVHRLVQLLDTAIVAFDNLRVKAAGIPGLTVGEDEVGYETPSARDAFREAMDEYNRVMFEMFVKHNTGPDEVAREVRDKCVEYFCAKGQNQEPVIAAACDQFAPFFRRPWRYLAGGVNRGVRRLQAVSEVRDDVISALSRLGEGVSDDIRYRLRNRCSIDPLDGKGRPTTEDLVGWISDTCRPLNPHGSKESPGVIESTANVPATTSLVSEEKSKKSKTKGKHINARMLELLQKNPVETTGWSCYQWATVLDCDVSMICSTPTWKGPLRAMKALQKAERIGSKEKANRRSSRR